jgi:glycosyltransferase involved in cell wall biosynthesis
VGWLPKDEYDRALLGARAVVVPLRAAARSAGQQTYLNAMMLGKPVIVTDVYGVHDYISDRETGLITAPDPVALREALEWVLDPGNTDEVTRMTERAKQVVNERFLLKDYFGRLWHLATAEM